MNVLGICAGIGGLELGLKLATNNAARAICLIEREAYCLSVLRARMQDGRLDPCPLWTDVATFDAAAWRGKVDCVTAGYPCGPFSLSGKRRGSDDERHLWPHIARHIRTLAPTHVFCENVPGHLSLGFEQVCADLQAMGYSVAAGIFSAAEVGAPHLRKRLFFLACRRPGSTPDTHGELLWDEPRRRGGASGCAEAQPVEHGEDGGVASFFHHAGPDYASNRKAQPSLRRNDDGLSFWLDPSPWRGEWEIDCPRVAADVAHRADRLRALGNAVVPQTAAMAYRTLLQRHVQK